MQQRKAGRTYFAAAAEVDELHPQVALLAEHQVAGLDVQVADANLLAVQGLDALADGAEEAADLVAVQGVGWLEPLCRSRV